MQYPLFTKRMFACLLSCGAALSSAIEPSATEPNDPRYWQQWHLENKNNADIDAVTAWQMLQNVARQEVVVAIIDSAMDTAHYDLRDNLWVNPGEIAANGIDDDNNGLIDDVHGYDFRNDEGSTFDGIMLHATPMAGLIAAQTNNGLSTAAVTGDLPIKIMTLQMINISEILGGDPIASRIRNSALLAQSTLSGMEYAIDNGAKILNMSLNLTKSEEVLRIDAGETAAEVGASYITTAQAWLALPSDERGTKPLQVNVYQVLEEDNPGSTEAELAAIMEAWVQQQFDDYYYYSSEGDRILGLARDNNVLIITAGLNTAVEDFPGFPAPSAINDNVIKVGAMSEQGQPSVFSEYGRDTRIYAPGENIISSMPSNDLFWLQGLTTGTSFATPIVSAIAAMAYSVRPDASYGEIKAALEAGVEETPDFLFNLADGTTFQAGRIRAPLVLQALGYTLPQGQDAQGLANAPIANYVTDCGLSCDGLSPVTVTFDASSSTDEQGSNLSYEWDFGDGLIATGAVVSHEYSAPLGATFMANVTVTDDDGFSDKSRGHRVEVLANGVDHVTVQFNDSSGYTLTGALLSGDFDINTTWYGGRFLNGSGTVEDTNGDQVTVTFVTTGSGLGLITGSVTVVTADATYSDGYTLAPTTWNSANRTLSTQTNGVDWTVVNGND